MKTLTTLDECAFFAFYDHTLKLQTPVVTLSVDSPHMLDNRNTQDTTKPRPHACHIDGCGKSFRRRSTLKEHLRTHTGEKTFRCSVESCQRRFTTSGNLSRHKRAQHPWLDAPLECLVDDCGCTFASEAKLERHMAMVHFSASSHSCVVRGCGRAFSTAGNLRRHLKQHHGHGVVVGGSESVGATPKTRNERVTHSPSAVHDLELEPLTLAVRWSDHCAQPPSRLSSSSEGELVDLLACLFD